MPIQPVRILFYLWPIRMDWFVEMVKKGCVVPFWYSTDGGKTFATKVYADHSFIHLKTRGGIRSLQRKISCFLLRSIMVMKMVALM